MPTDTDRHQPGERTVYLYRITCTVTAGAQCGQSRAWIATAPTADDAIARILESDRYAADWFEPDCVRRIEPIDTMAVRVS